MTDDTVAFLRERHPDALELALWVRELVHAAEPDLAERVYRGWDGIGFRHPDAGYLCAIYPQPDGTVRLLFEHGTRLDDRDGLLEGDGAQTRYVAITEPSRELAAAIGRYVEDAVAARLFRR